MRPATRGKVSSCLKIDGGLHPMIRSTHHEEDLYIETMGVDDSSDLLNIIVGVLPVHQLVWYRSFIE